MLLIRPLCRLFFSGGVFVSSRVQVSRDEGAQLAAEYGIQFFETSAKNDINVEKGFITIAREVKDRLMADGPNQRPSNLKIEPQPSKKKAGCC